AGHALGMWHEQSRPEAEDYVTVSLQNIQDAYQGQFTQGNPNDAEDFGVPYDYGSVMHYEQNAFSVRRDLLSMRTKDPKYQWTIGQRDEPSFADVKAINAAY
ncbi:hypothetical protein PMAYCL1PPCAC_27706, partial [Pristionchus mayeri]